MPLTIPLTFTLKETQKRVPLEYPKGFWVLTCGELECLLFGNGKLYLPDGDKPIATVKPKALGLNPKSLG
jgi:hypothetical protein